MESSSPTVDMSAYLKEKIGAEALTVLSTTRVAEGMSSEMFFFDLEYVKDQQTIREEIVIRREPLGGIMEVYDLEKEFKVQQALFAGGIKTPEVLWHEPDAGVFERPFYVMKKVEGDVQNLDPRSPSPMLFGDDERPTLADDFVDSIVKIHRFDWKSAGLDFLGDTRTGKAPIISRIEQHEAVIERAGFRHQPILSMAINWLKENAPEIDTVSILHMDYRTGNFISKDGRICAILDWELCRLGDVHEDLAYILSPAWRSAEEGLVNHLMTEEAFLKNYSERSQLTVDPYKLLYFGALMCLRALDQAYTCSKNFGREKDPDLRDGLHSMPSFIEPINGALLGVMGILRAI